MVRFLPAVLLLLATISPSFGVVHAAGPMQIVGCAEQGYTMPAPERWVVTGGCSPQAIIISSDKSILMTVRVSKHRLWNTVRAESALAGDLGGGGAPSPTLMSADIGHRHYLEGRVFATDTAGTPEEYIEIVTLQSGYVYRFFASLVLSTNPTATIIGPGYGQSANPRLPDARDDLVMRLWSMITITR